MIDHTPRRASGRLALPWLVSLFLLSALSLALQACRPSPEPAPGPPPATAIASPTSQAVAVATLAGGTPAPTVTATAAISPAPPIELAVTATITAAVAISPTASPTATAAATATVTATPCPPAPAGWAAYTVQPGDTLYDLSLRAGVSMASVVAANCLGSTALLAGQTLLLPPLPEPTATPCAASPPASWRPYTVRAGDTLSALAATRGASVAQIMAVNCLGSSTILVGQTLYLPPLAVAAAPLPTTAPPTGGGTGGATPPPCPGFSCPASGQLPLALAPGGPNNPNFTPCDPPRTTPWISAEKAVIEMGERLYLFACDFAARPLTATLTLGDGTVQNIPLGDTLRNLDLQKGNAQAVAEWMALPDRPIGLYQLTISDEGGESTAPFSFLVRPPTREHILVDPQAAAPGAAFTVYYINFDLNSTPMIELHREDQPAVGANHTMSGRGSWQVAIDRPLVVSGLVNKGWAAAALPSRPQDKKAAYAVSYNNQAIFDLFWLW